MSQTDSDLSDDYPWERNSEEDETEYDSNEDCCFCSSDSEEENVDLDSEENSTDDNNDNDDDDDDDDDNADNDYCSSSNSSKSSASCVINDQKVIFISTFEDKVHANKVIVSYLEDINNYRKKYSELPNKSHEIIDKIWGEIKVKDHEIDDIPLFIYEKKSEEKDSTKKKDKNDKLKIDSLNTKNQSHNLSKEIESNSKKSKPLPKTVKKIDVPVKKNEIPEILKVDSTNDSLKKVLKTEDTQVLPLKTKKSADKNEDKNLLKNLNSTKDKNKKSLTQLQKSNKTGTEKQELNPRKKKFTEDSKSKIVTAKNNFANSHTQTSTEKQKPYAEKSTEIISKNIKSGTTENKKTKNVDICKKLDSNSKNEKTSIDSINIKLSFQNKNNIKNDNKKLSSDNKFKNIISSSDEKNNKSEGKSEPQSKVVDKLDKTNKSKIKNVEIEKNVDLKFENLSRRARKNLKKLEQKKKTLEIAEQDISTSNSKNYSDTSSKIEKDNYNNADHQKKNKLQNIYDDAFKKKINPEISNHEKNKTNSRKIDEKNSIKSSEDTIENDIDDLLSTDNEDLNLLANLEQIPTFIAKTIRNKEKNQKSKTSVESKNKISKNMTGKTEQDFAVHIKKYRDKDIKSQSNLSDLTEIKKSLKLAEEAVDMAIVINNLSRALECINQAIFINPMDHRHYLNRSYIYLRMNQPRKALEDAQYIISSSSHVGHLFIAFLRAGQAAFALKKYLQAETYFIKATQQNPENIHAPRELLRVKIARLVSTGFNERDVISALRKYHKISKTDAFQCATDYLNSERKKNEARNKSNAEFKNNNDSFIDDYKDSICLDDEDDNDPSIFKLLNMMLNYKPGEVNFPHLIARPLNYNSISVNTPNELKNIAVVDSNKNIATAEENTNSIWVGNLKKNVTEEILKKQFMKFGHVVSVYKPPNENYAFINFESNEDVNNVMKNSSSIEISGMKILIRAVVFKK